MKHILLILFVLCSLSFFGTIKFQKKFEEFLPLTIFSIVIIAYIFGFFNILKYNIYLILILSILFYLIGIYYLIKNKNYKRFLNNFFTPAFLLLICLFLFLIIYNHGRYLISWDEFSHWGAVVKSMYYNSELSTGPHSYLQFKSYLPGISLWLYDIQLLLGSFTESYLVTASKLYYFGLFLYFFKYFSWKDFKKIFLVLVVVFLLPTITYSEFYFTILIDPILAYVMAFLILYILFTKKLDFFFWSTLTLGTLNLFLLKDVGKFFVIVVFIILMFKLYMIEKSNLEYNGLLKKYLYVFKKYYVVLLLILISYFLIYYSWNYLIDVNNVHVNFSSPINVKELFLTLIGHDNTYRNTVVINFINTFFNTALFSVLGIDICSAHICLSLILWALYAKMKKSSMGLPLIFLSMFILYEFGLLLMYLFKFSEYEALNLASYSRYTNSFVLCFIIVFVGYFLRSKYKSKYTLIVVLICLLANPANTFAYHYTRKASLTSKEPYINVKYDISSRISEKGRFIIVVQNSNGLEWLRINYEIIELLNGYNTGWSYGDPYSEKDIWTTNLTDQEFGQMINTYDYCYFYNVDENFIKKYGQFFDKLSHIKNNTLFRFDKEKNKFVYMK